MSLEGLMRNGVLEGLMRSGVLEGLMRNGVLKGLMCPGRVNECAYITRCYQRLK